MDIKTFEINVKVGPESEMENITGPAEEKLETSGLREGSLNLFVPGATGSISTIEYEPGLQEDFPSALEEIAPKEARYKHHERWGDDNGSSHVRATLMGPGTVIPFSSGELLLGTWQQIVVINHDTRERKRKIILQFIGK